MNTAPRGSSALTVYRHAIVSLAILLNAVALGIIVAVHKHDFLMPSAPNSTEATIQLILPTIGAIIGVIITAVNALAITSIVTAYAKSIVVAEGMTFQQMSRLHTVANAKIPFGFTPLFALAVIIALAEGLLPSALVSSLTPTNAPWSTTKNMPIADFSADSGVDPYIVCEYYDKMLNISAPGHGYGINCPMNNKYGDMYNVALQTLWQELPVKSMRNGTSYPSDLMGITGAISQITSKYASQITDDEDRAVIASDYVDTCLPRIKAAATCGRSLREGQSWNMEYYTVNGPAPQGVVGVELCTEGQDCSERRFAPHFRGGVTIIFWEMDTNSGNTTTTLYNFGSYNDTDWHTDTVQCNVGAREEMVPVRIRGGASVEHLPSLSCPTRSQPSPQFLLNVTRLADMTFIKSQGPSGNMEAFMLMPEEIDRVQAFARAIEKVVETGAMEMYWTQYMNESVVAQWAGSTPLMYTTTRVRLGGKSSHTAALAASPIMLIIILVIGWIAVARREQTNIAFNPLHPSSTLAAGMNRAELSLAVEDNDSADDKKLDTLPVILRFKPVTNERWGIDTRATPPGSTNHGRTHRRDGSWGAMQELLKSPVTPETPDWRASTRLSEYSGRKDPGEPPLSPGAPIWDAVVAQDRDGEYNGRNEAERLSRSHD